MSRINETDLYPPVKAFLEGLGYEVKAEIRDADVVAIRGDEPPVLVELKAGFSLTLLQQGIARQSISDDIYLAVPRWKGKAGYRAFKGNLGLCKRLGLGVLTVRLDDGSVQVHHEPGPFQPRKSPKRKALLMKEFVAREGDPNLGGTAGSIVTAYRQDALRCLAHLAEHGASKGAAVAKATSVRHATRMMRDNHYGWFEPVSRGVYELSAVGREVSASAAAAGA